jgi:hypothetical protein
MLKHIFQKEFTMNVKAIPQLSLIVILSLFAALFSSNAQAQTVWQGITINTVNTNGGVLVISGTAGDDNIALQRTGARQYAIAKYDQNWRMIASTRIDNVNFDLNALLVSLGDGNDAVFIGTDPSSWFIRNLYVYGGNGDDGIRVTDPRIPSIFINGLEYQF